MRLLLVRCDFSRGRIESGVHFLPRLNEVFPLLDYFLQERQNLHIKSTGAVTWLAAQFIVSLAKEEHFFFYTTNP